MDSLNKVFKQVDTSLAFLHNNVYVKSVLVLVTLLYASLAAPNLPSQVAGLFEHTWFKMLFCFLILAARRVDASIAILLAVAFVLCLQTLTRYHVNDMTAHVDSQVRSTTDPIDLDNEGFPGDSSRQPLPQDLVYPPENNENMYQTAKLHLYSDASSGPEGQNPTPVTGYHGHGLSPYGSNGSQL